MDGERGPWERGERDGWGERSLGEGGKRWMGREVLGRGGKEMDGERGPWERGERDGWGERSFRRGGKEMDGERGPLGEGWGRKEIWGGKRYGWRENIEERDGVRERVL